MTSIRFIICTVKQYIQWAMCWSTYTYRRGLVKMDYGFASAVDLFKNVIAFVLIISTNKIANHINEYGIW